MKTWKRLISGLFALALVASLSCAALAAEGTAPKGQFSQWFPQLGADAAAPESSEAVLANMGTVIRQSKTAGGATATLYAALWDGETVRLFLTVKGKNLPKALTKDSNLYYEECSLELPEAQRKDYLRKELGARGKYTPEELEKQVQTYLERKPSYFRPGFSLRSREGDTLTFDVGMFLKSHVEQPELTLHMENIAIYEESEDPTVRWQDGKRTGPGPGVSVLKGPFDFTFTLEKALLPVRYTGAVEVTQDKLPLRFTAFELSALDMELGYEVLTPVNPIQVTKPGAPAPEKPDNESVRKLLRQAVQGLWTKEGKYVDCSQGGGSLSLSTNQDGSQAHGSLGVTYPYPIDPASVTAVNLGGTRVELSALKRLDG